MGEHIPRRTVGASDEERNLAARWGKHVAPHCSIGGTFDLHELAKADAAWRAESGWDKPDITVAQMDAILDRWIGSELEKNWQRIGDHDDGLLGHLMRNAQTELASRVLHH